MDRLTFLYNEKPAFKHNGCVYKISVARRLYEYEATGLTPKEIKALQADNKRLHKLLEEIEETVLQKGESNEQSYMV